MPASDKKAIALIYATLKEYGFDPVATHEWEDARKIFIGSSPDLIVINLDKPDDEAIEKLELLRNCVKTKDVPVIIVSSSDRNDFNMGYPLNGKEVFMTSRFRRTIFFRR